MELAHVFKEAEKPKICNWQAGELQGKAMGPEEAGEPIALFPV